MDGEVGMDVEETSGQRLVESSSFHGLVDDQAFNTRQLAKEANEPRRVQFLGDGLQRGAPGPEIRVGKLLLVDVDVIDPVFGILRRELLCCSSNDVRKQKVVQNNVGKGSCGRVALPQIRQGSLEGGQIQDHLAGLLAGIFRQRNAK